MTGGFNWANVLRGGATLGMKTHVRIWGPNGKTAEEELGNLGTTAFHQSSKNSVKLQAVFLFPLCRVKEGCTLAVWWDKNRQGAHMDVTSDIARLSKFKQGILGSWDDAISSFRCYCQ